MKLHTTLVLTLFLLFSSTLFGQDILYKKDGTKDSVIVEEVNPTEVVYKKFSRPDGPLYRLPKSQILLIEYKDGAIDVFDGAQNLSDEEKRAAEKKVFAEKLGRNIISINYLNLLNGNIQFGYERIMGDGMVGLKYSFNYNIEDVETDILNYLRLWSTGFDLNLYPTGQGKIKYFLGPSFRIGAARGYNYDYLTNRSTLQDYNYFSIFFSNGFYAQPTKSLYLGVLGGIGMARFKSKTTSTHFADIDGIFAFNMGWRF